MRTARSAASVASATIPAGESLAPTTTARRRTEATTRPARALTPWPSSPAPSHPPHRERGNACKGHRVFLPLLPVRGVGGGGRRGPGGDEGLGGRAAPLHVPRRDRSHRDGGSTVDRRGTGPAAGLRDALPSAIVRVSIRVS